MSATVAANFHIWVTLGFVALAAVMFSLEKITTEITALVLLCGLLLFFHVFPLPAGRLGTERLLQGFGNSALIAVIGLLVIGEGLVQTDALNALGRVAGRFGSRRPWITVSAILIGTAALSGFVNNTPLVIIFIPILQSIASRLRLSPSQMMMPLSFATILGGMTTLLGSSTNLLVSSSLIALDQPGLGMFEVTPVGLVVAVAGMAYVLLLAPRLLPRREGLARLMTDDGKQFIAQLTIGATSRLVGARPVAGLLRDIPELVVKLVQRGEHAFAQPLDDIAIQPGDMLVVAGTRAKVTEALLRDPGLLTGEGCERRDATLAEVMIVPRSPMAGSSLEQLDFRHRTGCVVVGLRRRAQVIRQRMTEMRLEPGDVLLVQGSQAQIQALRHGHEVVVLEGSFTDLRQPSRNCAMAIFLAVILLAATGLLPIALAAIIGSVAMIVSGTLSLGQAGRAVDRRIVLLVGSALALGEAMDATGAAAYLAQSIVSALDGASPAIILSAFAAVIMMVTNVLSNNACAVLFTPIGVGIAQRLGVDPHIFAIAVLIASDGCFATPIGYQTNLLVMAPGSYTFADFVRFGLPLTVLVWATFSVTAALWFGL